MKHLPLKTAALAAALSLLCAGCAGAPASSAPASSGGASSSAPASDAPAPDTSVPAAPAEQAGEYRAMWVSYLEWESFDFSSEAAFAADADAMMQNCADLGLNVVIAQVRPFADALYPSELFPWSHLCTGAQGGDPGFDPLAVLVEAAHSRGLELEAWLNPYRVRLNATRPAGELAASSPALLHPEWVKEVDGGLYFDPSLPEVRQLITDGVLEILRNYDVDGIHFDDYFYPTTDPSFDAAEYTAAASGLSLEEWRRENVNQLMRQVYAAVKAEKPAVRFGVSPQGNMDNNYNSQYSDVSLWMAEGGYVDYVLPQLYWGYGYTTGSGSTRYAFENISAEWAALERAPSVALYFGLGAYRIGDGDGGNYDAAQSGWQTGHTLADMVATGRQLGADGYVLYRYDFLYKNGSWADLAAQEVENLRAANAE
ncbi:MAG TPA: family 10 glycosylhydrolase [Candidatus Fournierella merdavium]|nr:family 10 glycosylhydrolase [Candidatus Fournierella merdavium]